MIVVLNRVAALEFQCKGTKDERQKPKYADPENRDPMPSRHFEILAPSHLCVKVF
jgi:hypothetical protein